MRDGIRQMAVAILASGSVAAGQRAFAQTPAPAAPPVWQYSAFGDFGYLGDPNEPANHWFRNRGTTAHVDELDVNMLGLGLKTNASESSRWGTELTVQAGTGSEIFGSTSTAPNI